MTVNSIVAVGVGNGGIGAIERMIARKITGVKYVAVSNDVRLLGNAAIAEKLLLENGIDGCGGFLGNTSKAKQATTEIKANIVHALNGAEVVFISAALGGATGSGGAPVIGEIAHEMKMLVVGLVSMPFTFEGNNTCKRAGEGFINLKKHADIILEFKKDNVLESCSNLPMSDAYTAYYDYFSSIVKCFTDLFRSGRKRELLALKRASLKAKPIVMTDEITEQLLPYYVEAVIRYAALKKPPKVCIFWYYQQKVLGDFFDFTAAETYGNFVGPRSSHYDFWAKIQAANPELACEEYEYIPRGRVLYSLIDKEFIIVSSATIVKNTTAIKAIRRCCNIPDSAPVVLKTDQHYENPNDLEWEEE